MSSKKDLVEAHSFNRRRLVTAFVSGAPGGREVEPVRYGRTLVGGLVLAVLVVAGAAVTPLLKPTLPKDWNEKGLVIGKQSGSRFVAFDKTLYPVINTTSARLVLGTEGDFDVNFVPDEEIAKQKQGTTIGIPGAPDLVPRPGDLVQSGWSACTSPAQGVKVDLSTRPAVTARPGDGLVVTTGDRSRSWLVAGQHRYPLPTGERGSAVLRSLGLDADAPTPVPGRWLDLTSPADDVAPFSVERAGARTNTGVDGLDTVGTPVRVDDRPYVLGAKGLVPLTEFAYAVYRSTGLGAQLDEVKVQSADVADVPTASGSSRRPYPVSWPTDRVTPFATPSAPCLLMTTRDEKAATVELATAPAASEAISTGSTDTRSVDSGHGALVQGGSAGVIGAGTVFLVDATGTRYAVGNGDQASGAMRALGYAGTTPAPVPPSWLELFADGPELTPQAAARASGSQQ